MLLKNLVLTLVLGVLVSSLVACEPDTDQIGETASISQFLQKHWPKVLPPQGETPANFSDEEASLAPQACGECHAAQYEQWSSSLHSHTMGAGIQWQLQLMSQQAGNKCLQCHAPLAEQKALVALQQGWPNVPSAEIPEWLPPNLADTGLVCAVCHVRQHQRFGPPPRNALPEEIPHAGFTASEAFQDSGFCAACHQHKEHDSPPRVNGKLQVDTWAQWQNSPQAAQDIHCQTCHMPDRQHLWRGIHDVEMTRRALEVQLQVKRTAAGRAQLEVQLHNRDAGHHFPTYMVPKITLTFTLRKQGASWKRVIHKHIIGWQVNVALTEEEFDQRIPAGETHTLQLPVRLPVADASWIIDVDVDVAPREHYERTFRQSMKHANRIPPATLQSLRQALSEAEATRYRLMQLSQTVPAWVIAN
ncbi:MAG: cytochrome c family protein [Gammaproteobacteria bacterium]|nr:cytochrome c family protein [Gammaproteobacteria bacterium]